MTSSASTPGTRSSGSPMAATVSYSGCICERRSSGMGWAMRLVLIEQIVSERAARRIEYHRDAIGRLLLDHLVEHVEHAQHRAGRLTLGSW